MTRTPLSRSKGQRSRSPGRFTHRRVGSSGSCSGGHGNVLAVRNCCYVAVCSAAQGASAPTGRRGGDISWRPPAYSLLTMPHCVCYRCCSFSCNFCVSRCTTLVPCGASRPASVGVALRAVNQTDVGPIKFLHVLVSSTSVHSTRVHFEYSLDPQHLQLLGEAHRLQITSAWTMLRPTVEVCPGSMSEPLSTSEWSCGLQGKACGGGGGTRSPMTLLRAPSVALNTLVCT